MFDVSKEYKHPEFVVYCIEIYKNEKGISGKESYNMLKKTGAVNYIDDCYESLHCMGNKAIIFNIDNYIKN